MRIDLSDLERLEGFAFALARLFWCLMAVAFLAAILGSAGTGLLVLLLGGAAFVGGVGLEDFVRPRREPDAKIAVRRTARARRAAPKAAPRQRPPRPASR